jgi:hypothetical protein
MLDLEDQLKRFCASSPQNLHSIKTIEVSHSQLPQTYYFCADMKSLPIRLEDRSNVDTRPVNMDVKLSGSEGNLDQKYTINLDLTGSYDEFRDALDAVDITGQEKIVTVYREYLSNNLRSIVSRVKLQAQSINFDEEKATVAAITKRLSIAGTGQNYDLRTVPMLRSFV